MTQHRTERSVLGSDPSMGVLLGAPILVPQEIKETLPNGGSLNFLYVYYLQSSCTFTFKSIASSEARSEGTFGLLGPSKQAIRERHSIARHGVSEPPIVER